MGTSLHERLRSLSELSYFTTFASFSLLMGVGCSADAGNTTEDWAARSAALTCNGPCRVYVDPGADQEGDGSSWTSPLISVQSGLDAAAAQGGGEVWVRAGGPFETLAGEPDATLLVLRDGVELYGGFVGSEGSPDERNPAERTVIAGAPFGEEYENPPLIVGAADAAIDGFSILGQHGPAIALHNVMNARVSNVTIQDGYVYETGLIDVLDSDAVLEGLIVSDSTTGRGVPGVLVAGSTLRVAGSEFARLRAENGGSAGIQASSSTLVLDGVRFANNNTRAAGKSAGLHATDSDVLVVNSLWLGNTGDRGSLEVTASRFFAVSSHWEGNLHTGSTVRLQAGTTATFLNTSFVANSSFGTGIVSGRDSNVEIVSATFADNVDTYPQGANKPDDVAFVGSGKLTFSNSYSNRGAQSIFPPFSGSGNCLLDAPEPYRATDGGVTQVLLRHSFGCTNSGSNPAARSAARRARWFAASLGAAIPLSGDWWHASSSVVEANPDRGRIDPGRHYP